MSLYVETSALLRIVLDDANASTLAAIVDDALATGTDLVSSSLLETELDRVAFREGIDRALIDDALDGIYLAPVDQEVIDRAAGFKFHVKTLDALHLATATVLVADLVSLRMLSCDKQVIAGAELLGLAVASSCQ